MHEKYLEIKKVWKYLILLKLLEKFRNIRFPKIQKCQYAYDHFWLTLKAILRDIFFKSDSQNLPFLKNRKISW